MSDEFLLKDITRNTGSYIGALRLQGTASITFAVKSQQFVSVNEYDRGICAIDRFHATSSIPKG